MTTKELLIRAKDAKEAVAALETEQKNAVLRAMADALIEDTDAILAANEADRAAADGKITPVMMDRLALSEERIAGMAEGIREVALLPDPVGEVLKSFTRPNGMQIEKIAVPMGVIAIIYESRPNVTSDAAALALKAGSACVLRCGKEAHASASAIVCALKKGMERAGRAPDALQLVEDTSRASSAELMTANGLVDLLLPRGGAGLIRAVVENATVPVIRTGTGICHIYVDREADFGKALNILENAKCSRPSVCNAAEVCVVHRDIAKEFLPQFYRRMVTERAEKGLVPVELRLDEEAAAMIPGVPAGAQDFDTEFLNYVMAVRVVGSAEEAIAHISRHSTGHSDCIVTENEPTAAAFVRKIDSAAVYVNVSTRFTDGGEFGLGCEMGISTQKLHARGPMGLQELCTSKYVIRGNGQIR